MLATVDESTYGEDDGNTADDDHPISWCSDYDGGRTWYTAMGHTQRVLLASANFRKHILGGLETAARDRRRRLRRPQRQAPPTASDFEKVTLDDNTQNPMELDVAQDGRVFYIERDGRAADLEARHAADGDRRHDPGHAAARRTACSASQLAPDFAHQQLGLPLLLAAAGHARARRSISRFKVNGDTLDLAPSRRS